jgi:N-acetylneuraminic acid mutarotase
MVYARTSHTASVLTNGKVLVTGGETHGVLNTAELYDPSTGTWSVTGSMKDGRAFHTASVLTNGKILVTGGTGDDDLGLNNSELYDPSTGTWEITGKMHYGRCLHVASLLTNGSVLVTGGGTLLNGDAQNTSELYDPSTGTWTITGSMHHQRLSHTASLLTNGRVLVTGGGNSFLYYKAENSTELYDPSTGTWTNTGSMHYKRGFHLMSVLTNGNVLVTGGTTDEGQGLDRTELYDPSTETCT